MHHQNIVCVAELFSLTVWSLDILIQCGLQGQSSIRSDSDSSSNVLPRIVVFGGRGFVGSHVCQAALNTGLHVVGVSRSGECIS